MLMSQILNYLYLTLTVLTIPQRSIFQSQYPKGKESYCLLASHLIDSGGRDRVQSMDFLPPSLPPFECCPHTISPWDSTIHSSLWPWGHNLEPHRITLPLDADSRMGRIEKDDLSEFINNKHLGWNSTWPQVPLIKSLSEKKENEPSNLKIRSTVLSRRTNLKSFSFERKKEKFSLFPLFYLVEISFLWLVTLDKRIKLIFDRVASTLKQWLDAEVPPTPLVLALAQLLTYSSFTEVSWVLCPRPWVEFEYHVILVLKLNLS